MAEVIELEARIDNKQTIKSIGQMEEQFEDLQKAIKETTDPKEFKKLQRQIISVGKEIKDVELSLESLDSEQIASEVGSVVGAFSDVAGGAMLAFGASEKSAESFLRTFAQVQSVGMIVKGSIEGVQSGIKLYNNVIKESATFTRAAAIAQGIYSTVVGTSTGALKLFRLALLGTGIGAIVILLGVLISNFEAVSDVIMGVVNGALSFLTSIIGTIIDGLEWITGLFTSSGDAATVASNKITSSKKRERDEIAKNVRALRDAAEDEKEMLDEKIKGIDFEIRKRKAAGDETVEQERRKLEITIESETKRLEFLQKAFEAERKMNDELVTETLAASAFSESDDLIFNALKGQVQEANKAVQKEQNEQIDAVKDAVQAAEEELTIFDIDQKRQAQERAAAAAKAAQEAKDEAERKRLEAEAKLNEQLAEQFALEQRLRLENMEDGIEKEKAMRRAEYALEINDLAEQGLLTSEIRKQLKIQLETDLAEIDQEFKEEALAKEREQAEKEAAIIEERKQRFKELIDARAQAEEELINVKRSALETGLNLVRDFAGENETLANVVFVIQKALAIGQIIAETTKGIAAAKANVALIPPLLPPGIPNPAFAVAAGTAATQITGLKIGAAAQIASLAGATISKFKSGGTAPSTGGSSSAATAATGAGPAIPSTFGSNGTNSAQNNQTAGTNQGGASQAFVLQGDLISSMDAAKLINLKSKFD